MARFTVDNPATETPFCERDYLSEDELWRRVERARATFESWRRVPLPERIALIERVCERFEAESAAVAADITGQMGKPLAQAQAEVRGMVLRARSLCEQAPEALATRSLREKPGFERRIGREPLGVVLDIAAWNYPLLVPVNVVVAAVLAGNSVLLKHSPRTPLCGEHFERLFRAAGAPEGLVTAIHVDHPTAAVLMQRPEIGFVSFTGSVRGGKEVYQAASRRVLGVGLELGGKDAAYVCSDCDFDFAVTNTAEGVFYNAGQSCCAVERIFVDEAIYDRFIEAFVAEVRRAWRVGDPTDGQAGVGPLALPGAPERLEAAVRDAVDRGGRLLLGGQPTHVNGRGRYFEPTVVADAPTSSRLMREESFGPVIGLVRVKDEDEAVGRINDSPYGLTASVWSRDAERAARVGAELEVGTVFMNRCDYLDPELPWTGAKESGLGSTLSTLGFLQLTRPKAWHFRVTTGG